MPNSYIFQDIMTGIENPVNARCITDCVVCYGADAYKCTFTKGFLLLQ